MHPQTYRGWVGHLARRGNIVVYPRYQEKLLTPPAEYTENTVAAIRAALAILKQPGHVAPDLERVAVVGHSAGGVGAVNYTVRARAEGLPVPRAVMIVEPGQGMDGGVKLVPLDDCGKMPAAVHLLVVVGDADGMVGASCARTIWQGTRHVGDRSFVTVRSDDHGSPPLRANHLSPVSWTREATDAIDWFGYWKTFDGLMSAAFADKDHTVDASMGTWSDGTPVTPLSVER
jgi:pimeloyl-ACP methyl ester carboxylesterase